MSNFRIRASEIAVDDVIDVRDTNSVWCQAKVIGIVVHDKEKGNLVFKIRYLGWNELYDEYIPASSMRLANKGFYTGRDDLPRYENAGDGSNMLTSRLIHPQEEPPNQSEVDFFRQFLSNILSNPLLENHLIDI